MKTNSKSDKNDPKVKAGTFKEKLLAVEDTGWKFSRKQNLKGKFVSRIGEKFLQTSDEARRQSIEEEIKSMYAHH